MSRLGELLDQLVAEIAEQAEAYEHLPPQDTDAWIELRLMADDMDRVLGALPQLSTGAGGSDDVTDLKAATPATAPVLTYRDADVFLSVVDGDTKPLVIGWTSCGRCTQHVRNCKCPGGPSEPKYIQKWAAEEAVRRGAPRELPTPVDGSEIADGGFAGFGVSVSADSETVSAYRQRCRDCGEAKDVSEMDADDDGGYICFACQEAS